MRAPSASPQHALRRQAAAMVIAVLLCISSSDPKAAIVDSGPVSISVPDVLSGHLYLNLVTGINSTDGTLVPGWDFDPFRQFLGANLTFFATIASSNLCAVVAPGGVASALLPGDTIGPSSTFSVDTVSGANFHGTAVQYIGILFNNETTSILNYGYLQLETTSPRGFPATIQRYVYDDSGAAITIPGPPPVFLGAASRKVHGAAGAFDLPLSAVLSDPTTEPRLGPTLSLVFTFDKPMGNDGSTFSVTEGSATVVGLTAISNSIVVDFNAVSDQQYLTFKFFSYQSLDGGLGGPTTVRLGLLAGDVNQNRVVTVADLGLVNAQLAQPVTATNFLKDVNASGTLSVADKGITNANLTHSLPAP